MAEVLRVLYAGDGLQAKERKRGGDARWTLQRNRKSRKNGVKYMKIGVGYVV